MHTHNMLFIRIYIYIYMPALGRVFLKRSRASSSLRICYIYIYIYIYIHIHTYIHTYTIMHTYIHTYIHTYNYIYIYIYIYVYTHICVGWLLVRCLIFLSSFYVPIL